MRQKYSPLQKKICLKKYTFLASLTDKNVWRERVSTPLLPLNSLLKWENRQFDEDRRNFLSKSKKCYQFTHKLLNSD